MLNAQPIQTHTNFLARHSKNALYYRRLQVEANQAALDELVFILRQHQHQHGWVLLIAPQQLPSKALFAAAGVDVSRLLLIQQKQISNIDQVLTGALSSNTCACVVVWQEQFSRCSLTRYQSLAASHQTCFYQLSTEDELQVKH